jgi:hypothetical protein
VANLRNIFRKIMAGPLFTQRLAATHPPRKNLVLPQEKLRAFSLPQDSHIELMFGAARFGGTAFKCLTRREISHRAASTSFAAAPRHTAQVLQSAPDFRCDQTSRRAMRPKHLQRRSFSQASARSRRRLAFGLPQGA